MDESGAHPAKFVRANRHANAAAPPSMDIDETYDILASRRSLARRSSYSSVAISPAAYLLCRSCRGVCIPGR